MPAGPRCGDKAEYEYEVDSELIGLFASVFVTRLNTPGITADSQLEIKKTKTTVVWPDQDKGDGSYYGGRKFDPRGLDKKSYEAKFDEQKFKLDIMCIGEEKGSGDTIEIKAYDPVSDPNKVVGMVKGSQVWEAVTIEPITGKPKRTLYDLKSEYDAEYFERKIDLEFKDGVVIIMVKIFLVLTETGRSRERVFNYIKKRAEDFWNSDSTGFNQWIHHRKNCVRKEKCNCSVIKDSKGEYTNAGCCKIPLKLKVEMGGEDDNWVYIHFLSPGQIDQMTRHQLGIGPEPNIDFKVNQGNFPYPEDIANTYAHEVGHMMGFPDQYETGTVAEGAMSIAGPVSGSPWPIDDSSIMGKSMNVAKKIHTNAKWFSDWINSKLGDDFEVIKK